MTCHILFSPFQLQRRRYSLAAFRLAEDGFRLLEITFAPYTDKESLMMQLYLELGVRLMEAEVRYKRPPPTDDILEELEGVVHYMNDFLVCKKYFLDVIYVTHYCHFRLPTLRTLLVMKSEKFTNE